MMPPLTPVWLAGALASRAMQRPMRFADDPPRVRLPENPSHPMAEVSHRTTVRSMALAEGPERQAVAF